MSDSGCVPLLHITRNLRYQLVFLATVHHRPGMDAYSVDKAVNTRIMNEIGALSSVNKILFYESNRRLPCMYPSNSTKLDINFVLELFVFQSVNRVLIEKNLTLFLSSTIQGENGIHDIKLSDNSEYFESNAFIPPRFGEIPTHCPSESGDDLSYMDHKNYHIIKVSEVLFCPQVDLEEGEYNITDNKSLRLLRSDVVAGYNDYDIMPNGKLRVCLEYLESLNYFGQGEVYSITDELKQHLWIVSLACTSVSVICLSISLLIYCVIPGLRTTPGKLIMLLMVSLLFTLVFQQLTFVIAGSHDGCIVVGLLLHFCSLAVFTSMNACNFHMYKVFKSTKTRKQNTYTFFDKKMIQYTFYIYFSPLVVVTLNIIVHVIGSEGSLIGYGGVKCFIADTISTVVAFITPISLICISNIFFFISTAITIHRTPNPKDTTHTKHRQEIGIFVRLTSITGISWLLQIVDSFFSLSALSFVATIINLLQGMFIFLAFVANRRNIGLLREKSVFSKETSSSRMLQSHVKTSNSSAKAMSNRV